MRAQSKLKKHEGEGDHEDRRQWRRRPAALTLEKAEVALKGGLDGDAGGVRGHGAGGAAKGFHSCVCVGSEG